MDRVNATGKHAKQSHRHGEGSVVLRTDKYRVRRWVWQGSYVVDGKRHRPRVSATTEKQAWKLGARIAKRIAAMHESGWSMDTTVAECVMAWLDSRQVRASSLERYRLSARGYIIPTLGHIPVDSLTIDQVRRAVRSWGAPGRIALLRLRSALDQAVAEGSVTRNVARLVTSPRAEHREQPTIGPEQLRAVFAACRGDWLYPIVVLAGTCGLRRGEILGLRRADIDGSTLTVAGQVRLIPLAARAADESPYQLVPPKSAAARRTISLPPIAVAALTEHLDRLGSSAVNIDGLIFTSGGQPLNPNRVTRRFDVLLKRAGIRGLRLHDMRHAYATLLNAQGVGTRTAMALLGHATESQTHHYTAVLAESRKAAADEIQKAIGGES